MDWKTIHINWSFYPFPRKMTSCPFRNYVKNSFFSTYTRIIGLPDENPCMSGKWMVKICYCSGISGSGTTWSPKKCRIPDFSYKRKLIHSRNWSPNLRYRSLPPSHILTRRRTRPAHPSMRRSRKRPPDMKTQEWNEFVYRLRIRNFMWLTMLYTKRRTANVFMPSHPDSFSDRYISRQSGSNATYHARHQMHCRCRSPSAILQIKKLRI